MRKTQMSFIVFLIMLISVGTVFANSTVSTVYHLWNVRNDLGGTHTQTANIDLAITAWQASHVYAQYDVVYSGDIVYYSTLGHTSGDSFAITNWTKMSGWTITKGWDPIGSPTLPFHGNYDGGVYTISNLFINRGASDITNNGPTGGRNLVGLFGHVSNGTTATDNSTLNIADIYIKNVELVNVNVTGQRGTGALIGKVMLPNKSGGKTVIVQNCHVIGNGNIVKGFGAVGGLVGANNSDGKKAVPIIRSCSAKVTVSSTHPTNTTRNPAEYLESWNVNAFYTPYNIKYGGLVGCNENGITQDCFATGNVSGGDRVGGLAGCTIGGGIFRSYATGTVTQNIRPSTFRNWESGVGPLVGLVSGTLPFGLGSATAVGAVEDSYYGLNENNTPNGYGTPLSSITDNTFPNWNQGTSGVWTAANPPQLTGGVAGTYYFRATTDGDWFATSENWQSTANSDYSGLTNTTIKPDYSNSLGINIPSGKAVTILNSKTANISTTTVGGFLTVDSGGTLNVQKNNNTTTDLTVTGTLNVEGDMNIGQSATALISGTLTIGSTANITVAGELILPASSTYELTGTTITFNGGVKQTIPSQFATFNNLVINNPGNVEFSTGNKVVSGTFTHKAGEYSGQTSMTVNGYSSKDFKRLYWPTTTTTTTESNIEGFSAKTEIVADPAKQRIARTWTIGSSNTTSTPKTITFYWSSSEDYGYNWTTTGSAPVLYNEETPVGTFTESSLSGDVKSATFEVDLGNTAKSRADRVFKIGLADNQTLPVLLSSFTSINSHSNGVMIQWVSQSESDLDGYRIYRNNKDSLEEALMLDAFFAGTNTTQTQTYTYFDKEELSNGVHYYWIQMIDYDGTNSFYGPAPVEINNEYDNSVEIPLVNGIASIYPNPFNPVTTIRYSLVNDAKTVIELYNIKGQRVKVIDPGYQARGFHSVVWDGTDNRGQNVASGIYFTRITIGKTVDMKKIVLMK